MSAYSSAVDLCRSSVCGVSVGTTYCLLMVRLLLYEYAPNGVPRLVGNAILP